MGQAGLEKSSLCADRVPLGHLGTPVAAVSGGMVPAGSAAAGVGITGFCVSVTGAGTAGREAPVTREAAIALPTVCPDDADTLTAQLIADWTLGTLRVTCTICKTHNTISGSLFILLHMVIIALSHNLRIYELMFDLCSRLVQTGK